MSRACPAFVIRRPLLTVAAAQSDRAAVEDAIVALSSDSNFASGLRDHDDYSDLTGVSHETMSDSDDGGGVGSASASGGSSGSTGSAVTGAVVGGIAGGIALVGSFYWYDRRRKEQIEAGVRVETLPGSGEC